MWMRALLKGGSALVLVVSLSGSALAVAQPGGVFTDDDGSVHEANIEFIAAKGIAEGCNPPVNDLFCPDQPVTRAQMATFLTRALSLPLATSPFTDTTGSVHEASIGAVAETGITVGCNPPANNLFCPDQPVTRAQMATFLTRALSLPLATSPFTDTAGSVHEASIGAVAETGITVGCNPPANDLFCPEQLVTRAQMATFLTRALSLPGDCTSVNLTLLNPDAPGDDTANPNGEWVQFRNESASTAFLSQCRVEDEGPTHTYTFPAGLTLGSGAPITLYSGCGTDTKWALYWCAGEVWDNAGDTITVRNPDGTIVDEFTYDFGE